MQPRFTTFAAQARDGDATPDWCVLDRNVIIARHGTDRAGAAEDCIARTHAAAIEELARARKGGAGGGINGPDDMRTLLSAVDRLLSLHGEA